MEVVDEKKNKQIAAATTVGLHALLLVAFFFIVGWRAPDPPYGSTEGFVINLGFDDQGSGDVQPLVPIGSEQQEAKPEEVQAETPKQEEKVEDIEPKPVQETLTAKDDEAVAVKDVKKEEKKEEKKTDPIKPVENPKEKVTPKTEQKPLAVYKSDATKKTDGKAGQPGGEGDDVGKAGDKGQPDGQLGPGAYKGKAGGGGNGTGGLDINGWYWDDIPKVEPPENESDGRLVFQIKVNAEGEIIDIKTLTRTLSIEMENKCRKEIEKLTFSKTGNNVPDVSTGKITFVVRSN